MHVIQLARYQWLVVDNHYRARFLIVEGPLVFRETGETHVKHRVEWWAPDPKKRNVLTVCDGLLAAETWCLGEITKADEAGAALSDRLDVRKQGPGVAAAGLTWSMDVRGEQTRCFVVVTREARDAGGEVHDRMPAFLTPEAMDAWLEPVKLDRAGRDDMLALLDGSSTAIASTIEQYVVDRKVNNSRTVDPSDATVIRSTE